MGITQRRRLYFIFSFLFLYFLIDDSIEYHERFGEFLANFLHLQPGLGLRAVDFGELLVSAVFGLLFVSSIALGYFLSDPTMRSVALYLIGMIVILAGFGVVMDMVEILITHAGIGRMVVILEEAGEMLVMSIITWFAFSLSFSVRSPATSPKQS